MNQYGWPALLIILIAAVSHANSVGRWERNFPSNAERGSSPIILKWGVFHRSGKLKLSEPRGNSARVCDRGGEIFLWVTHRLSSNENLSASAGERLGRSIATSKYPRCASAVELDIEPLTSVPPWFVPFVRAVKAALPNLKLRLAVYGPTAGEIPGPHASIENLEKLLVEVDGLDWMLYDTGLRDKQRYRSYFQFVLQEGERLLAKYPSREILFGLPAYSDRTSRHDAAIENIGNVHEAWQKLNPVCNERLKLAAFAAWSMTSKDTDAANQLSTWRREICKGEIK